ncbi:hypothetical protein AVEN_6562-1, partial [Araneus ventricosus]
ILCNSVTAGVVQNSGEVVPAQKSSSSSDHGLKLGCPSQNSHRDTSGREL